MSKKFIIQRGLKVQLKGLAEFIERVEELSNKKDLNAEERQFMKIAKLGEPSGYGFEALRSLLAKEDI